MWTCRRLQDRPSGNQCLPQPQASYLNVEVAETRFLPLPQVCSNKNGRRNGRDRLSVGDRPRYSLDLAARLGVDYPNAKGRKA